MSRTEKQRLIDRKSFFLIFFPNRPSFVAAVEAAAAAAAAMLPRSKLEAGEPRAHTFCYVLLWRAMVSWVYFQSIRSHKKATD